MFALLRRCWKRMHKPEPVNVLEPLQPRVMPDPDAVAALERRRAALSYQPENGFLVEPAQ